MASSNADLKTRISTLRHEILSYKPGKAVPCDYERVVFPDKLIICIVDLNGPVPLIVPALRRVLHGDKEATVIRQTYADNQEEYLTDSISLIIASRRGTVINNSDVRELAGKANCIVLFLNPDHIVYSREWIRVTKDETGTSSSEDNSTEGMGRIDTSQAGTVSEMEFLKLAKAIHPSDYEAVGISLGIPIAQLENILIQKSNNYTNAFLRVFTKWNVTQQPPHSNRRQLLADKLQEIDLGGLSDRLLKKTLIPSSTEPLQGPSSSQPQQTSFRSTKETLENVSGEQEDFDDKLNTVARKVARLDEIDKLGKALGFHPDDIQRYVDTNTKNAYVSYMGTLLMLRDWRKKQTKATECEALKCALKKADQIRLADELFGTS